MSHAQKSGTILATTGLTIGAIGVVFGDIGTSPLYAFREALAQTKDQGISQVEIFGVLSLALWALILVVSVKYVLFLMRADNNGEGGVLSLMALAKQATGGWTIVTILGAAGAALFYGDAIITPALSVLSAVEGLKTIPSLEALVSEQTNMVIAVGILIALFAVQSFGTANVSKLFGPICLVWFLAIGWVGLINIVIAPHILIAINPQFAVQFLMDHGTVGLFVLGAVFLTVTGAEALTADMGHFGRFPIRLGWFLLVFPALTLNYFGQGAFALAELIQAEAAGKTLESADWFFMMTPESMRLFLVLLATCATIIASQAVITGAYSLTQQGIGLGLFPRMQIKQTSEHHSGQIFVPTVNWLLLAGVVVLIMHFRNSSAMAAAYGIAVTGTMVVTTCLAFIVIWKLWKWPRAASILFITPFLVLDLFFFGANFLRVVEGGWVPLVVAAGIGVLVYVWLKGRAFVSEKTKSETVSMTELAKLLRKRPPYRVAGTAVFLTSSPDVAPAALLHNLKHNHVLHTYNIIATVVSVNSPYVEPEQRLSVTRLDDNFQKAQISYGYMETQDVPSALFGTKDITPGTGGTSFFIGRHTLSPNKEVGMPIWQDLIFIFLHRNASNPTDFFQIPPNRVVELGSRMGI